ncbi:hypothetical protein OROGR_016209 [Orobanche gracilis]
MSSPKNSISDIIAGKDRWTVIAKVIRLWKTQSMDRSNLPFSLEMVLMDSKGDKIHASAKKTIVYKFDRVLKEGNVYSFHHFAVVENTGVFKYTTHPFKLNFYLETKVNPIHGVPIPISPFNFMPISDILCGGFDQSYLVDVIGIMTGVGTEKDIIVQGNRTKKNVIEIDWNGSRIDCALFGVYVDELNAFLASGDTANTVVVIQLAKVKMFQDKITLQNAFHCTKLLFNPDFPEAVDFKKRATANNDSFSQGLIQLSDTVKMTLEDEFLKVLDRKTVEQLKMCKERVSYGVLASITHIVDQEDWWYYACKCNKSVYPDSRSFFCESCNKHVINVIPRYRIRVAVSDCSGTANFVIFDRDANDLFNKSCHEMIELQDNNNEDSSCPKEITALVDKTFVFKVESCGNVNPAFEPSFRVKKMTSKPYIIEKFEEGYSDKSLLSVTVSKSRTVANNLSVSQDGDPIGVCHLSVESQRRHLLFKYHPRYKMSSPKNSISDIIAGKDRWTVIAKVIRLWKTQSMDRSNLPFSLEMVLMDSKGDKIHASAKKTIVYKFDRVLKEGNVYSFHHFAVVENTGVFKYTTHPFKLNFYLETKVNPIHGVPIPISPFNFMPISDILCGGFDQSYLVDVIGIMTGVGTEKDIIVQGNRTKKNVIEIDWNGSRIDCALFGVYVDELNAFLASGDTANTVVVIQLAKVKMFQDFPEAVDFKKRATANNDSFSQGLIQLSDTVKMTLEDEFLKVLDRKTVEQLKMCKERVSYGVLASITHIVDQEDWWYYACKCNKSVYLDSRSFFCESCNKHVINVIPRYRIRVAVSDCSGTANFVIFDRDANDLFNKSCHEMIELQDNNNEDSSCPKEITALVDKTFVFKVESCGNVNPAFEPSFRVKKMTSKPYIIEKFEEGYSDKSLLSVTVSKSRTVANNLSVSQDGDPIGVCHLSVESQRRHLLFKYHPRYKMSSPKNSISDIIAGKDRWTVIAKVIRLWKTQSMDRSNLPFSLEMVLMDSKGDKIHASAKKTIVYKFDRVLKEGNVYSFHHFAVVENTGVFKYTTHPFKLNFYLETKVNPIHGVPIPISPFNFMPISDILCGGFDQSYLVDVIGIMTGVGTEKDIIVQGNRTKKNVIEIDWNGSRIDCALFGVYVDELNAFLASGDTANTVVVIQLAKVKMFQDFPEAVDFKKRATANNDSFSQGLIQLSDTVKMTLEDEFLKVLDRKTVEQLKMCKERVSYGVLASITHIVDQEDWWYYACKCNKSVYPDSRSFFCESCNKHVINVIPRYRIRVAVSDCSGTANFVIFDRDANDLFNKSCHEMIELQDNNNEDSSCPKEITALVDKTFVFKVESCGNVNPAFEPSFRVKKMTSKPYIIEKFEEGYSDKSLLSVTVSKSRTVANNLSVSQDGDPIGVCHLSVESQ